jgi:hypothetical protein
MNAPRLRTGFQDTVEQGYYLVDEDEVAALGLKNGDLVTLWEEDCIFEPNAVLLFSFRHPLDIMPRLWAKVISN